MSNVRGFFTRIRFVLLTSLLLLSTPQAHAAIVVGNPEGEITLDFVYDYQCTHCHHMFPIVQSLISHHSDLRVRLYPVAVLNNNSLIEATTAIAATQLPGKFQEITDFLMYNPPLQESEIVVLLHKLNLDNHSFLLEGHRQWVKNQLLEGLDRMKQANSTSVPVFLIHKDSKTATTTATPVVAVGEQSYNSLEEIIDHVQRT